MRERRCLCLQAPSWLGRDRGNRRQAYGWRILTPRTVQFYLASLLLLIAFALLVFSVGLKSPTMDEQNHIARGLAYLRTGDLRLSQEHPPGVNAWTAWPLLLDPQIVLPLDSPSWANAEWYGFADQLLWRANNRPQQMTFAARVPVMWLTVLLVALAYRWARALGGGWAGLIAMALLAFDPNILAHGRLATTDMGVTCLAFAAMFALWGALSSGRGSVPAPLGSALSSGRGSVPAPAPAGWTRWVLAGIALGAAQVAKFSALILVPLAFLVAVLAWIARGDPSLPLRRTQGFGSGPLRGMGRWIARLLILFGTGFGVVWAVYGFQWGPIALPGGFSVSLSTPAPAYWAGIQTLLRRTGGGAPSFLMGQHSPEGWWYYFPIALAIKTPLPTLILLAVAIGKSANRQIGKPPDPSLRSGQAHPTTRPFTPLRAGPPNHLLCLILPVVAFWAMAIGGSFQIGYRHILPSLPFLYVLAAWQMAHLRFDHLRFAHLRFMICALLILWLAASTIAVAPHYLAFFNVLAGGPDGGYRFLVDSNLDWGQDLPGLQRYVQEKGIARIYLSWFGAAHPEAYQLAFHPLPGFWRFGGEPAAYGLNPYAPAPGIYAISASNLQGLPFADHDLYAYFRGREPSARIGHSIFVYRVEGQRGDDQAIALGVPMAQLAEEERALLGRVSSIRQYDPATGYIIPRVAEAFWAIAPRPPEWGHVVREGPGYVVVRSLGCPERAVRPSEGSPPERDARCGPFVKLIACQVHDASARQGQTLALSVQWMVSQAPHRAATSFAHLLDGQGRYVAGWDGLTAPATCWQEGDLVGQEYSISLPADLPTGPYQVEAGWYDADTLQRWPCSIDGQEAGDRLLLAEVEIRR